MKQKPVPVFHETALWKEEGREHLLKEKIGIEKVNHFVVSRFPVITDNERVIPFNRFDEWCAENERRN